MDMTQNGNERIEDLQLGGLKIIRRTDRPGYTTDAVLLADFAKPRAGERLCDLGTGIGILPLLLLGRQPSLHVTAIEIQEDLAQLAKRSMALNALENSAQVLQGDIRDIKSLLPKGSFDAVIANPPYFPQPGGTAEKHQWHCGDGDIATAASWLLKAGGDFTCCCPAERVLNMADALRSCGLEPKRLRFVSSAVSLAPYLCLMAAKRGAKPGIRLMPQLTLYDSPGVYSKEARRIYHMDEEGRE